MIAFWYLNILVLLIVIGEVNGYRVNIRKAAIAEVDEKKVAEFKKEYAELQKGLSDFDKEEAKKLYETGDESSTELESAAGKLDKLKKLKDFLFEQKRKYQKSTDISIDTKNTIIKLIKESDEHLDKQIKNEKDLEEFHKELNKANNNMQHEDFEKFLTQQETKYKESTNVDPETRKTILNIINESKEDREEEQKHIKEKYEQGKLELVEAKTANKNGDFLEAKTLLTWAIEKFEDYNDVFGSCSELNEARDLLRKVNKALQQSAQEEKSVRKRRRPVETELPLKRAKTK